jgi:hypothetical protein
MALAVAELAELVIERAHRFLGSAKDRTIDSRAMIGNCDRRHSVYARFECAAKVGGASPRSVYIGNMYFDVRDTALEAGEALADLLFDAGIALGVTVDLVVCMDLDEQCGSPLIRCFHNAGESPAVPFNFRKLSG